MAVRSAMSRPSSRVPAGIAVASPAACSPVVGPASSCSSAARPTALVGATRRCAVPTFSPAHEGRRRGSSPAASGATVAGVVDGAHRRGGRTRALVVVVVDARDDDVVTSSSPPPQAVQGAGRAPLRRRRAAAGGDGSCSRVSPGFAYDAATAFGIRDPIRRPRVGAGSASAFLVATFALAAAISRPAPVVCGRRGGPGARRSWRRALDASPSAPEHPQDGEDRRPRSPRTRRAPGPGGWPGRRPRAPRGRSRRRTPRSW